MGETKKKKTSRRDTKTKSVWIRETKGRECSDDKIKVEVSCGPATGKLSAISVRAGLWRVRHHTRFQEPEWLGNEEAEATGIRDSASGACERSRRQRPLPWEMWVWRRVLVKTEATWASLRRWTAAQMV